MRRALLSISIALAAGGSMLRAQAAQTPAQAPAPAPAQQAPAAAAAAQPPATTAPAAEAESYTYNPDGRRDPFTSLIGTGGTDVRAIASGKYADGPGAMAVADISVRGVLQTRGSMVAMIQGPDNRTYLVHQGDKLLDGTIKSITAQGLVVVQEVNDPLSLVKQREVSKLLRSVEAVKQ
jgi:type IV pilus assembly protein PilP